MRGEMFDVQLVSGSLMREALVLRRLQAAIDIIALQDKNMAAGIDSRPGKNRSL